MRRKSAIDEAKQKDRIERARGMTPEARLPASIRISHMFWSFVAPVNVIVKRF